ncbi:hypothetical protein O0544_15790 [Edwardsiella anguillarum]|nr:hypothetical protein [Edwardsiella anguillarum]
MTATLPRLIRDAMATLSLINAVDWRRDPLTLPDSLMASPALCLPAPMIPHLYSGQPGKTSMILVLVSPPTPVMQSVAVDAPTPASLVEIAAPVFFTILLT